MAKILGLSASLRNGRLGFGAKALTDEIRKLSSKTELVEFIVSQTKLRSEEYMEAGRKDGKPFDEIYKSLRRLSSKQGLSNSEAAVTCALWGAAQNGAEIEYLSLADHFRTSGEVSNKEALNRALIEADGIVLSTPVYFGDRSSLAQSFLEYCLENKEISRAIEGKVYGGLTVGAKRNGGQETTLIYQMLDMVNANMLAVGNSSETTSQYGGTAVAGDIGTFGSDEYGINTCIGTGARVAEVAEILDAGKSIQMRGKIKLHLWLLQDDKNGDGKDFFTNWSKTMMEERDDVEIKIWDIAEENVARCIACDVCPIDIGSKEDYRCIISSKSDFFKCNHAELLEADAVLLCAYSPEDKSEIISNYQQFIERTRYIRRDNYLFSNLLFSPFVVSELNARQNLHLRMITSGVRHNTVIHHPLIGMLHKGGVINEESLKMASTSFIDKANQIVAGRIARNSDSKDAYSPLGYKISKDKAVADAQSGQVDSFIEQNAAKNREKWRKQFEIIKND